VKTLIFKTFFYTGLDAVLPEGFMLITLAPFPKVVCMWAQWIELSKAQLMPEIRPKILMS